MTNKPLLKPIGSIAGIGGRSEIRRYLKEQFSQLGFEPFNDGVIAFAKFSGSIEGQQISCSFSLLKLSQYFGLNQDQQFRYQTFQGIRLQCIVPCTQKTRLIIAKRTQGKWLKRITNLAMRFKKFKTIDNNYLNKKVYSPDVTFANAFINDLSIRQNIRQLTDENTQCTSWGLILIPEQLTFNITFANLDDFETDKLHKRLSTLIHLVKAIENQQISQELSLTQTEILARDNPKKLMWRGLRFILLYILLCVIVIGTLFLSP